MADNYFICVGMAVKAPQGSMHGTNGYGCQIAEVIPVLKNDKSLHDYQRPSFRIDLEKQLYNDTTNFSTLEVDGFGLSSDGIDLPVPELELPDPSHLRLTTIGGKWPIGRNVGVAYVHQRRLAQADAQASITSAGGLPIEGVAEIAHVSAVDSASGRRFIGFRAKYLRTVSAGVVEVSLYRRGTNATPMPALRLTSADCDASPITLPYPGWRFAPLDPASPPASPQEVDVMVSIPFVLKWSAPYRALLAGPKVPFWLW
ncbi:MAG: hypothetical protein IPH44_43285 [Myxococcales bacterium]|nr:hypothetical protein [Myxococcales bacterium]MBK7192778.1 hypothetical protein [Myxococcales bacterium]MBP6846457.1 hypothetical protein [Kofleriaceae bacterium]